MKLKSSFQKQRLLYEIIKDLSSYPKSVILVLCKKYNIPFVNKNVAINIIAQQLLEKNFNKIGRMDVDDEDFFTPSKFINDLTKYIDR